MLKLPLAVTAVTSVLVTLATGAVAQKIPPEIPLAVICWNEQTKTWRVANLRYQRGWHCDLYWDRWTAFEYCECEGCRGAALQSPG